MYAVVPPVGYSDHSGPVPTSAVLGFLVDDTDTITITTTWTPQQTASTYVLYSTAVSPGSHFFTLFNGQADSEDPSGVILDYIVVQG